MSYVGKSKAKVGGNGSSRTGENAWQRLTQWKNEQSHNMARKERRGNGSATVQHSQVLVCMTHTNRVKFAFRARKTQALADSFYCSSRYLFRGPLFQ